MPPEELESQEFDLQGAMFPGSARHWPDTKAVGSLTMRCSESRRSVEVAIVASHAPGH